jgi:hypothetical protein
LRFAEEILKIARRNVERLGALVPKPREKRDRQDNRNDRNRKEKLEE